MITQNWCVLILRRAIYSLLLTLTVSGCGDDLDQVVGSTSPAVTSAPSSITTSSVTTSVADVAVPTSLLSRPTTTFAPLPPEPFFVSVFNLIPSDIEVVGFDAARDRWFVDTRIGEGGPGRRYEQSLPDSRVIEDQPHLELDWARDFDAPIIFSFTSDGGFVVATGGADEPTDHTPRDIHFLDHDGKHIRSVHAPKGLLWIQPAQHPDPPPAAPCEHQDMRYPGGLSWVINTTPQTLVVCRDNEPISSAPWGGGMGEFSVSIDSNNDGIEEFFVGGTSVGGGGGTGFSLIGNELLPILTDDGQLAVRLGHTTTMSEFGCKDGYLVQVDMTTTATTATATRTFYEVTADRATIANVEIVEWQVDDRLVDPSQLWAVWDAAPPLTDDLSDCRAAPSFDRVLAARPDGTVLLNSIDTVLDEQSPCGESMPLVTWKNGISKAVGRVNGRPLSAVLSGTDSLNIVVNCDGQDQEVETHWGGWWIDNHPPTTFEWPPAFSIAGTDLTLTVELLASSNSTCDVNHRPRRMLVVDNDGASREWLTTAGEPVMVAWIGHGAFVSTPDGKFGYIEDFTCRHEGPQKSVVVGTFDPATGAMISSERLDFPDDFQTTRFGWRLVYPDVLSIDVDGRIIGWLGTGDGVKSLPLSG